MCRALNLSWLILLGITVKPLPFGAIWRFRRRWIPVRRHVRRRLFVRLRRDVRQQRRRLFRSGSGSAVRPASTPLDRTGLCNSRKTLAWGKPATAENSGFVGTTAATGIEELYRRLPSQQSNRHGWRVMGMGGMSGMSGMGGMGGMSGTRRHGRHGWHGRLRWKPRGPGPIRRGRRLWRRHASANTNPSIVRTQITLNRDDFRPRAVRRRSDYCGAFVGAAGAPLEFGPQDYCRGIRLCCGVWLPRSTIGIWQSVLFAWNPRSRRCKTCLWWQVLDGPRLRYGRRSRRLSPARHARVLPPAAR